LEKEYAVLRYINFLSSQALHPPMYMLFFTVLTKGLIPESKK